MKLWLKVLILAPLILLLAACTGATKNAEMAPATVEGPALIMFYTEN